MTKENNAAAAAVILLENGEEDGHVEKILAALGRAERFICVTAFAKMSGYRLLQPELERRIAAGMDASFVAGIDFYQTEPAVLTALAALGPVAQQSGATLEVFMGSEDRGATFHPKIYHFARRGEEELFIGSANLTSGGLSENYEISAGISAKGHAWEARLRERICEWLAAGEIVAASSEAVAAYAVRYNIYRAAMRAAERMARRAVAAPMGGLVVLEALLAEMRAVEGEDGFDHQIAMRRRSRARARRLIGAIAREPDMTPRRFEPRYGELIAAWHSSGLARGGSTIAKRGALFQQALRTLLASRSSDPAELFDLLKAYLGRIPRAGINVLTELLHTRDPTRFAVMNGNSLSGMRLAGFAYPQSAAKGTIDGARYARFCADADTVRARLGLEDLSALDALFNFAYWKPAVDAAEP